MITGKKHSQQLEALYREQIAALDQLHQLGQILPGQRDRKTLQKFTNAITIAKQFLSPPEFRQLIEVIEICNRQQQYRELDQMVAILKQKKFGIIPVIVPAEAIEATSLAAIEEEREMKRAAQALHGQLSEWRIPATVGIGINEDKKSCFYVYMQRMIIKEVERVPREWREKPVIIKAVGQIYPAA